MFKKMIFVLFVLAMLSFASSANAAVGCKKFNFLGSFTRTQASVDVIGDNTFHTWIFQLNLHSDSSATQFWSGGPDIMMNGGLGGPWTGSWNCRADGKLVVTMIEPNYSPIAAGSHVGITVPDILLNGYARTTYLYSVDSDNTLTRIQARSRSYGPNDDPANPAGGTLGDLSTLTFTFTRLSASDADLLLP